MDKGLVAQTGLVVSNCRRSFQADSFQAYTATKSGRARHLAISLVGPPQLL